MKNSVFLVFFLFCTIYVFSQERTYSMGEEGLIEKKGGIGTLVIIPFEDKMYRSDADRPIGKETGLNPGEIMIKFRSALLESLEQEMQKDWDILKLNNSSTTEEGFGLEFIYASIKYEYLAVPQDVMMLNDTTLDKKDVKNQKSNKKHKNGISEGQVVTHSNSQEKYMQMFITNDTLLKYMNDNLNADYYLFLTEFDILHYVSDPDRIASGGLQYSLKVHFTCIDKEGKLLVSGAADTKVNAETKNIYAIISQGFPVLTKKLAKMIRKYRMEVVR